MTKLFVLPGLLIGALLVSSSAVAQAPALVGAAKLADSAAREIDRGTIESDLNRLHSARTMIDAALATYPNDPMLLHYKGFEAFREASLLYGLHRQNEVPALMKEAGTALAKSDSIKPMPENDALLTSVLGSMIGADPSLAQTLGPDIQDHMTTAMSSGATNPRVWLIAGIGALYTPDEYGGGLSKAESQISKAIELFNTDHTVPPSPSWGRAEAYAWLGQILQRENKPSDALTAYNKALALEPNYVWVKYRLLPTLKK